ncbi:PadR family transcriptional regulator [Gephyromycinifex aptenodytis]|uniref:PadR family transcriptional regulator n=1 Tax=Gephyromycinifex aptenodytis TaxID=2716227 RepID=UPI0014479E05|nr:PadR family transcriptional regulator [Gephyromycinifex aptenodytis]
MNTDDTRREHGCGETEQSDAHCEHEPWQHGGPGRARGRGCGPAGEEERGLGHGGFGRGRFGGRRGRRARRGEVREAALLLLAEEPMNGYQIMQTLHDRTGGSWRPSPGAMYPALALLTDEGLIEPVEIEGRKALRLTEAAAEQVATLQQRPAPWEAAAQQDAGAAGELWSAYTQLGLAARAVGATHDEAQMRRATEALTAARSAIYRVLADEG